MDATEDRAGKLAPGTLDEQMRQWHGLAVSVAQRYLARTAVPERLLDPADLVNASLCGLWEAIRGYDPDRGSTFRTWAIRICTARVVDRVRDVLGRRSMKGQKLRVRGRSVRASASLDAVGGRVDDGDPLAEALACPRGERERRKREAGELVEVALHGLSERERLLVRTVYLEGATQKEAGRRAGVSESWVSKLLDGALPRMRERLHDLFERGV